MAYYYETPDLKGNKTVRTEQYRNSLRNGQFDQRFFWLMVLSSIYQGSLVFWFSILAYQDSPVTQDGKIVDFQASGVFAFCLIMIIVNIKLQFDLNNKSAPAFFISLLSLGIFYGAARALSIQSVSVILHDDLGGVVPQMLLTFRAFVVGMLATFVILLPEILLHGRESQFKFAIDYYRDKFFRRKNKLNS